MSTIGIAIMSCFVVIGFVFLNMGPLDKEQSRRQAYWARFQAK